MAIFAKANIAPPELGKVDITSAQESIEKDFQALAPVQLEFKKREQEVNELLKQLKECKTGSKPAPDGERYCDKFEKIAESIVRLVFVNDYKTIQLKRHFQKPEFDGFDENITDLCLSNYPISQNSFWELVLVKKYNCNEIVFECKNVSAPIDAKHVYQLFGYLTTGTGRFGVILCRNKKKIHGSATRAIEKIQKLKPSHCVLVFDDGDLAKMLDVYKNGNSLENYFLGKNQDFNSQIYL